MKETDPAFEDTARVTTLCANSILDVVARHGDVAILFSVLEALTAGLLVRASRGPEFDAAIVEQLAESVLRGVDRLRKEQEP